MKNDIKKFDENAMDMMLLELGFGSYTVGSRYVRAAIRMVFEDVDSRMTKDIYPTIAKQWNTTPARVERAIRHAIENAWLKAPVYTKARFFGNSCGPEYDKPTNGEYIFRLAAELERMARED